MTNILFALINNRSLSVKVGMLVLFSVLGLSYFCYSSWTTINESSQTLTTFQNNDQLTQLAIAAGTIIDTNATVREQTSALLSSDTGKDYVDDLEVARNANEDVIGKFGEWIELVAQQQTSSVRQVEKVARDLSELSSKLLDLTYTSGRGDEYDMIEQTEELMSQVAAATHA